MVIHVDVVDRALKNLKSSIILLSPQGKPYDQKKAKQFSKLEHLVLIAGHYEGFDERIRKHLVDEEVSIGDYILTGGELPAMVIVDTIVRLLPGVLEPEATEHESFSSLKIENSKIENLLDYPTYTRPENFKGWKVPKVLLSGNTLKLKNGERGRPLRAPNKKDRIYE